VVVVSRPEFGGLVVRADGGVVDIKVRRRLKSGFWVLGTSVAEGKEAVYSIRHQNNTFHYLK